MATVNEKMTAIADNIRSKTGGTEALELDDMASGVNDVYEAGKQAESELLYRAFLNGGKKNEYPEAFMGEHWTDETFKPPYNIVVNGSALSMFEENAVTNIKEVLENQQVILDLKLATNVKRIFYGSKTKQLPVLDFSSVTVLWQPFSYSSLLETIDEIVFNDKIVATETFVGCHKLREVRFSGTVACNVAFAYSPLTVESMKSVITHLKNYAGTKKEFVYKITFTGACITALDAEGNALNELKEMGLLTDEEISASGLTSLTWREYANYIGWNC